MTYIIINKCDAMQYKFYDSLHFACVAAEKMDRFCDPVFCVKKHYLIRVKSSLKDHIETIKFPYQIIEKLIQNNKNLNWKEVRGSAKAEHVKNQNKDKAKSFFGDKCLTK